MNNAFMAPGPQRLVNIDGRPISANEVPVVFSEENDAKEMAYHALGSLDDLELFYNDVLVVKYIREELSANIKAAPATQREDKYQNGIGLVLKVGPTAFVDDEHNKFHGLKVKRGDWVMYRISDGWDRAVQELYGHHHFAECRLIQDAHIRARVKYPGRFVSAGW